MKSFLQRYLDGERAAVWAEMSALGARVHEAAHAEDARAVAHETMRRARNNLDRIVERLDAMDYSFWDGVQGPKPPPGKHIAAPTPKAVTFGTKRLEAGAGADLLAAMFAEAHSLPPEALTQIMAEQLHNIYRTTVWPWQDTSLLLKGQRHPADAAAVAAFERAKKSPPAELASQLADLEQLSATAIDGLRADWTVREGAAGPPAPAQIDHRRVRRVLAPPRKKDAALVRRLQAQGVAVPLALGAWISEVGGVNLAGSHPALAFWEDDGFPGVHADPLMVSVDLAELDAWQADGARGSVDVVIGWDARAKARLTVDNVELDYGYAVRLPDSTADPPLEGRTAGETFVGYLRLAFAFGGFAGWADQSRRPTDELARLTDGLEPI